LSPFLEGGRRVFAAGGLRQLVAHPWSLLSKGDKPLAPVEPLVREQDTAATSQQCASRFASCMGQGSRTV